MFILVSFLNVSQIQTAGINFWITICNVSQIFKHTDLISQFIGVKLTYWDKLLNLFLNLQQVWETLKNWCVCHCVSILVIPWNGMDTGNNVLSTLRTACTEIILMFCLVMVLSDNGPVTYIWQAACARIQLTSLF